MSTVNLLSGPSTQFLNAMLTKKSSHCERLSFRAAEKLSTETGSDPFKFITNTEFDMVFEAMQKNYFEWNEEDCRYLHTVLIQVINKFSALTHQMRTGQQLILPKQRSTASFYEVYDVYTMTTFTWSTVEKEDLCLFLVRTISGSQPKSETKILRPRTQTINNGRCCKNKNVRRRAYKLSLNDFSTSTKQFTSLEQTSQPLWNSVVLMPSVL